MVGFFRRICKLLFFGVKPVFVFDGGAPALKRRTVGRRRERREGRREDAVRTAGKLLAVQMQRRMEEEEEKNRQKRNKKKKNEDVEGDRGQEEEGEEESLPENLVYVEELQMTPEERARKRQDKNKFRKKDAYHLPELDTPLTEMGAPNDPRIMSLEELQNYARQFDTGEDINVYDFSKIDFDSSFFQSLPDSDRYNVLNAARLRSRLRMGYSKEQLETMFPDRMAFSKFQIDRVRERNELTQRLMNINGAGTDDTAAFGFNSGGRVAGEKGREYVLVRNDGVEGGWALGVVDSKDEGKARSKPIDVDELHKRRYKNESSDGGEDIAGEGEDEDDFEDIPVEGLNRLPTRSTASSFLSRGRPQGSKQASRNYAQTRHDLYTTRKREVEEARTTKPDRLHAGKVADEGEDSLFFTEDDGGSEIWEDVNIREAEGGKYKKNKMNEEETQLQQAIQMSLQQDGGHKGLQAINHKAESLLNIRTEDQRNHSQERDSQSGHRIINNVDDDDDDDDDDGLNLHTLLSEARQTKRKVIKQKETLSKTTEAKVADAATPSTPQSNIVAKRAGFDGPLPFEKLNLGTSLLGRKKMQKFTEELEGGFEKEPLPSELKRQERDKKEAAPLPPWFAGVDTGLESDRKSTGTGKIFDGETVDMKEDQSKEEVFAGSSNDSEVIGADNSDALDTKVTEVQDAKERVIDVDSPQSDEFVDVEMGEEESKLGSAGPLAATSENLIKNETMNSAEDIANKEVEDSTNFRNNDDDKTKDVNNEDEALEWEESDHEENVQSGKDTDSELNISGSVQVLSPTKKYKDTENRSEGTVKSIPEKTEVATVPMEVANIEEQITDFEAGLPEMNGLGNDIDNQMFNVDEDDEQIISDPEEEELIRQLANEADEHERFAATLNSQMPSTHNQQEPPPDFDKQIKALRNQQKKDRRDADEITQTMITECQQLLSLFGLPYITAPMEAEAQCSRLVDLGLVDGIVTDDSDIFLFGGNRIYKNMFNQAKFVECYLLPDITAELGLDRRKLIAIAHLLGSDYTEGLPGIGPVTAVELLSEFADLIAFRDWYAAVQQGTRPKSEDSANPFRRKFRRNATKLFLPPSFPDAVVDDAYLNPVVDNDTQPFEWGVPDLAALRSFLSGTVGWSEERTDEILVPVIRDMNRREAEGTQANITRFFSGGVGAGAFAPRRRTVIEEGKGKGSDGSGLVQGQLGGNVGAGAPGRSKRLDTALGKIAGRSKGRLDVDVTIGTNDTIINGNEDGVAERKNGSADQDASDGGSNGNEKGEDTPAPARKKRRTKGTNKETDGKVRNKSKKRKAAIDSD